MHSNLLKRLPRSLIITQKAAIIRIARIFFILLFISAFIEDNARRLTMYPIPGSKPIYEPKLWVALRRGKNFKEHFAVYTRIRTPFGENVKLNKNKTI